MTQKLKRSVALLSAIAIVFSMLTNFFPSDNFNLGLMAFASEFDENGFGEDGSYQPAEDSDGDGYYEIKNAGQLYWFAHYINMGYTSVNAILTNDIIINDDLYDSLNSDGTVKKNKTIRNWTPVGNYGQQYTGTFNGNKCTVSGLYFNDTNTNNVGLFGYVGNGGKISDISVENSYFNGYYYVGGVCGYNYSGTIKNCYNTGMVNGNYFVGGVCGKNDESIITNCYNTGKVNASNCVGGICGYNNIGTILNCYNTGTVNGTRNVGGLSGYTYTCYTNNQAKIINCYNMGEVTSEKNNADGISGFFIGKIANCYYINTCTSKETASISKTLTEFANGEVAYLLSQGCTVEEGESSKQYDGSVWGQEIGKDDYPVFNGKKVYKVKSYAGCVNNPGIAGTGFSNRNATIYARHNMKKIPVKSPTCTENGNCEYWICSHEKGVYYKDKDRKGKFANQKATVINAKGHKYTTKLVKPTCTAKGYTLHICSACNNSYKDNYTNASGHKYVKVKVVKPTLKSKGYTLYKCSNCGGTIKNNYVSALVSISKAKVTGIKDITYTGKQIKPKITVVLGKKVLKNGRDYTLKFGKNKSVGKGTVTIIGKGKYAGKITKTFKILPAKTSAKLSSTKGKIKVTLKKSKGAKKYQIQYATNKKFKGAKKITTTLIKKSFNAKSKKTYYVRARSVNGKYVSGWSAVKKIKVK